MRTIRAYGGTVRLWRGHVDWYVEYRRGRDRGSMSGMSMRSGRNWAVNMLRTQPIMTPAAQQET